MAPYRRRRWWRRGRRWRRRRGPYRRLWKPRRSKALTRRRRVRRLLRRKKATIRAWEPDTKKKCIINGHMLGLIAVNPNSTNRMYFTGKTATGIFLWPEGGGVTLRIFSLDFLWSEHRLFRNCWSQTNDGYDLARYYKTTWYRLHPAFALCSQHVVFVRNQVKAGNHKTKKIFIKPPANMTNQWKFTRDLYEEPLFAWGMSFINWEEPYMRTQSYFLPIMKFNPQNIYVAVDSQGTTWQKIRRRISKPKLAYSPLVDKGIGNLINVRFLKSNATKPTNENNLPAYHTKDLPYWFSCWGQNTSYNFGRMAKEQTDVLGATTPWIVWTMMNYTRTWIESGTGGTPQLKTFAALANTAKLMANMGWFVVSNLEERVSIPVLYRSYWKWGGTSFAKQKITPFFPDTNQVSVKNPATVGKYVIRPSDLKQGLLTESALRRFLEPSKVADERGPLPWEERSSRYAAEESDVTTGSEAEESEEEQEQKCNLEEAVRTIRRRLQRERDQRHSLHNFFKSLLKQE
nr:ORF1 [Torque teno felis virus]